MSGPAALPGGPMAALQQKLAEKIRADIGELLPEELVREMVAQEARAFFFEPTVVRTVDSYGRETKATTPSAFQVVVRELALPMIEQAVKAEVNARAKEIDKAIREAIVGESSHLLVAAAVAGVVRNTLTGLAGEIVQDLQNRGVIRAY